MVLNEFTISSYNYLTIEAGKWEDFEGMQFDLPAQSISVNYQQQDYNLDKPTQWTKSAFRVWFKTCKKFQLEKHRKILTWLAYIRPLVLPLIADYMLT